MLRFRLIPTMRWGWLTQQTIQSNAVGCGSGGCRMVLLKIQGEFPSDPVILKVFYASSAVRPLPFLLGNRD
jgi:hypothetical protein